MNPLNHNLQLKKEIALFQNEFLLLFLKYNLAFQCNVPDAPGIIVKFKKKKPFLVHCILHAVFSNETTEDPVIKIDLSQSVDNLYWLEIESSGAPGNFFSSVDGINEGEKLAHFFFSAGTNQFLHDIRKESVEISSANGLAGSKIRIMLN